MNRQEKAIRYMLRNEDYKWDTRAILENLNDGAGWTFCGLTQRDDEKYLPAECPTIKALAELYKVNRSRAIEIIINVYIKGYWNPKYDELINERLAIRLFDLGVNMHPTTATKLLQRGLNDLGAHLTVDGQFGPATLAAANHYSLVGDDLEAAFGKNIDFFMKIFEKIGEIVTDISTFNWAEFALDMKDLAELSTQIYGKMIDDDVRDELISEAKDRYIEIARKPRFTRFLPGWKNRLNKDEYSI